MPISPQMYQRISFDEANPMLTGMRTGMDLASQGIKLGALPDELQNQSKAEKLKNALSQIDLNFAPQTKQANLNLLQAQTPHLQAQTNLINQQSQYFGPETLARIAQMNAATNKDTMLTNNPLLNLNGIGGEYGAYLYLKQHPELAGNINIPAAPNAPGAQTQPTPGQPSLPPLNQNQQANVVNNVTGALGNTPMTVGTPGQPASLADDLLRNMQQQRDAKTAQGKLAATRANAYSFAAMPVDMKNSSIAQAIAFGYDPTEASKLMTGDANTPAKTLTELGKMKGYDQDPGTWPEMIFAPTSATRTQTQRRNASLAELNVLGNRISEYTAPYASRVAGYSLSQIADAIKNEDPDKQAKFLAATILQPDLNATRIKVMSGQVGIGALKEIGAAAQNKFKLLQPTITPEVYQKANKIADSLLDEASTAANKASYTPLGKTSTSQNAMKNAKTNEKQPGTNVGVSSVKMPDGSVWQVPADKVQEAIKRGGQQL